MKIHTSILLTGLGLVLCGCNSTQPGLTNPQEPGPAAGRAVGYGVGSVVGNTAGAVVGAGEGAVTGASAPFKLPPTYTVQEYRTYVGPDGRTVRVPVQTQVDKYGRPINSPPAEPPPVVNGTNSVPPPRQ